MDISFNILKLIFYSHSRYFLEHDGANFKFPLQICPRFQRSHFFQFYSITTIFQNLSEAHV